MDPKVGEQYVEYSKNGGDGATKGAGESGLDVEHKSGHKKRVYLSKVEMPAPTHRLKVGDRLVALNGRSIEKYADLDAIRKELDNHNVIAMVVDPTMNR